MEKRNPRRARKRGAKGDRTVTVRFHEKEMATLRALAKFAGVTVPTLLRVMLALGVLREKKRLGLK
jgi:hypothetical protein